VLQKSDVFPAGLNGVKRYRIPGVVVTPKGTILAYAEARRNNSADWGEIEIHLRRSIDQGRTWTEARKIAHHGTRLEGNPRKPRGGEREQTVHNPVAIVNHAKGTLEFLYGVNYARCFSMRSEDDGVTWTTPRDITDAFEPLRNRYPWTVIATGPGHGIQLRSGRLLVPVWLAYGNTGDHHPSACATLYSDDHGQSWKAGEIAIPNEGEFRDPNESTIAELSNGHVMLIARNESRTSRKLITTSPDGATRWTPPRFHPELWEPICMAGLVAVPPSPGTLLFSNPHRLARHADGQEIPGGRGARENLTLKLSRDHGETWPVQKTLDPGASAYSDLAVLPDGSVLCLFESGEQIRAARFNLEWLSQP